ncbi:sister chromatid cohesion protein 1 [Podila humilis]|nr:sister chromatid cohesion protein 1 [Podila humilis]
MFFSEAILSKNGPLGKVWLAAHWERKLSKNQLLQTNINNSVDAIVGVDQAPMALRLSGQLLLGVSRIYFRKTKYLLEDCNEAILKLKVAVRTNMADNNLLVLDGAAGGLSNMPTNRAAFNAVTVADSMNELDLLQPNDNFDIHAWGLSSKINNSDKMNMSDDMALDDENGDFTNDLFSLDHGRRNRGLDIEVGRNHRVGGGGGYNTMDFDLGGPDDALDLDIFGDDLGGSTEYDFMKRPRPQVHDDLEIEVGRDAVTQARSVSVDAFGMLDGNDKPLRLASEEARAPSVAGSAHGGAQDLGFEFAEFRDGARAPLHFDLADMDGELEQQVLETQRPREPTVKKRKLIVDDEIEMSEEEQRRLNADFFAEGLLVTHEMLPRSRKLLRLQQIEHDTAHGGLAGYLLDCTAGPRVTGTALVPELASMFSRRLQIDQTIPELPKIGEAHEEEAAGTSNWQDDQTGDWTSKIPESRAEDNEVRHPSPNMFEEFQLETSPHNDQEAPQQRQQQVEEQQREQLDLEDGHRAKSSLFQEMDDTVAGSTKELHGTVFSTSAIKTMRLVHQNLGEKKGGAEDEPSSSTRATRQSTIATASSALNKDTASVTFSELLSTPVASSAAETSTTTAKRNRADAAKLFFELLVLSTKDVVSVKQEKSFGEIAIGGSPWLDTLVEADARTEVELTEA